MLTKVPLSRRGRRKNRLTCSTVRQRALAIHHTEQGQNRCPPLPLLPRWEDLVDQPIVFTRSKHAVVISDSQSFFPFPRKRL